MLLVCLCGMLAIALTLGFSFSSNDTSDDDDSIHMDDNTQFRVPDLIRDKVGDGSCTASSGFPILH